MDRSSTLRFSLDSSLGRLARWLRLLGHDAAWEKGDTLQIALSRARAEGRFLLTRSSGIARLGLSPPPEGLLVVRSSTLNDQLLELARQKPIFPRADPFSRCAVCNIRLEEADLQQARESVPSYVAKTQDSFQVCPSCNRIFWGASHTSKILDLFRSAAVEIGQTVHLRSRRKGAESSEPDPAPPER